MAAGTLKDTLSALAGRIAKSHYVNLASLRSKAYAHAEERKGYENLANSNGANPQTDANLAQEHALPQEQVIASTSGWSALTMASSFNVKYEEEGIIANIRTFVRNLPMYLFGLINVGFTALDLLFAAPGAIFDWTFEKAKEIFAKASEEMNETRRLLGEEEALAEAGAGSDWIMRAIRAAKHFFKTIGDLTWPFIKKYLCVFLVGVSGLFNFTIGSGLRRTAGLIRSAGYVIDAVLNIAARLLFFWGQVSLTESFAMIGQSFLNTLVESTIVLGMAAALAFGQLHVAAVLGAINTTFITGFFTNSITAIAIATAKFLAAVWTTSIVANSINRTLWKVGEAIGNLWDRWQSQKNTPIRDDLLDKAEKRERALIQDERNEPKHNFDRVVLTSTVPKELKHAERFTVSEKDKNDLEEIYAKTQEREKAEAKKQEQSEESSTSSPASTDHESDDNDLLYGEDELSSEEEDHISSSHSSTVDDVSSSTVPSVRNVESMIKASAANPFPRATTSAAIISSEETALAFLLQGSAKNPIAPFSKTHSGEYKKAHVAVFKKLRESQKSGPVPKTSTSSAVISSKVTHGRSPSARSSSLTQFPPSSPRHFTSTSSSNPSFYSPSSRVSGAVTPAKQRISQPGLKKAKGS